MTRPAHFFALIILILVGLDASLFLHVRARRTAGLRSTAPLNNIVTAGLGLTDLCLATEARYTRHPAVSDALAPFMDYPRALEHFPTGSFWAPPRDQFR